MIYLHIGKYSADLNLSWRNEQNFKLQTRFPQIGLILDKK